MRYDPALIEPKWQSVWAQERVFEVTNDLNELKKKPKYYVLDMFPYPSASGLHVGHPEGYTATDITARMKRMQGFNVLHPMGWDAFGLPAERAAVRDNIHPAVITKQNIDNFRNQIKRLGFSYDWSREISTSDLSYYRWTQWIFLKLYERGLAYLAEVPVNWCPALGTVLANEEVKDGKYVETGDPVERKTMRQWMLKITAYAERLLADLDDLDWPDGIKEMQRNWVGKSIGADIHFQIDACADAFTVFTTCPHTIFGVTFCVLAPEHPLVTKITTAEQQAAVASYVAQTALQTEADRQDLNRDKTGIWTGAYAINPLSGSKIPIWVADYVLANYGSGAVMGVPAHDDRDRIFAGRYQLPVQEVVDETGRMKESALLDGMSESEAITESIRVLEGKSCGAGKTHYRLRDWLFSRQRYWGEPFPIVHAANGDIISLSEDLLPVELPMIDAYKPTADGQPPLARASEDWLYVDMPGKGRVRRETNTMPQWAGSCWYYLRFLDPHNSQAPWDKKLDDYWMPVDLYIGGVEHAVLHLLYARFWHKVLFDCGLVHNKEPFQKLFNQGMILAQSYRDAQGKYYYPDDIEKRDNALFAKSTGRPVVAQTEKMSKSRFNVVNPDEVIAQYGADAMRLYELFMGPLEQVKMWQTNGVEGVYRFLHRVWRLIVDEESDGLSSRLSETPDNGALTKCLHKTVKKVTEDTEGLRFNTAISQMMSFVNEAMSHSTLSRDAAKTLLRLLAPYAPHVTEELWQRMGEKELIARASWPSFNPALCVDDEISVITQVNGKKREELKVQKGISKEELEKVALGTESVTKFIAGKTIKKVIVVPDRMINFVVE